MASAADDLSELKRNLNGTTSLVGNLNNIALASWTPAQAEAQVKRSIAAAGRGGGYLLCDQHGELPWDTPPAVMAAIVESAHRWGRYPLDWLETT